MCLFPPAIRLIRVIDELAAARIHELRQPGRRGFDCQPADHGVAFFAPCVPLQRGGQEQQARNNTAHSGKSLTEIRRAYNQSMVKTIGQVFEKRPHGRD